MKLSTSVLFKKLNTDEIGVSVEGDTLTKCQKVILGIAEDVISVCEGEQIWYQLGGGTALGAVRHGGFIPWDDDIDLNVLGKDFERLKKKMKEKYPQKYEFLDYSVNDYGLPMGRVMLKKSIFRDRECVNSENCGFFIDVFQLENVPDNVLLRKLHGVSCMISGGLLSCRKFYRNRSFFLMLCQSNPEIKSSVKVKIFLGGLISFIPLSFCARITDYVYGMCKNESSKYVSFPAGRKHYFGEMYLREGMINTVTMPFEGHNWQVAQDYDGYFKTLYGSDYMTPPPKEKQEHHVLLELKFPEEMEQT